MAHSIQFCAVTESKAYGGEKVQLIRLQNCNLIREQKFVSTTREHIVVQKFYTSLFFVTEVVAAWAPSLLRGDWLRGICVPHAESLSPFIFNEFYLCLWHIQQPWSVEFQQERRVPGGCDIFHAIIKSFLYTV